MVTEKGPTLLGRDWLSQNWEDIKAVACAHPSLTQLIQKYQDVFLPGVGTMAHLKAHLSLKEQCKGETPWNNLLLPSSLVTESHHMPSLASLLAPSSLDDLFVLGWICLNQILGVR